MKRPARGRAVRLSCHHAATEADLVVVFPGGQRRYRCDTCLVLRDMAQPIKPRHTLAASLLAFAAAVAALFGRRHR